MSGSADRPQWIPIQDMVSRGSIGEELLSGIPDLGARLRPETTFGKSLRRPSLFVQENPGLSTFGDILRLPAEKLATFSPKFKLQERLDDYLKRLLILPHSRLLAAIYGLPQFPAPPDREQEIVEGVEGTLNRMFYQAAVPIFIWHFGLYDGITRTIEATGKQFKVTRVRIREVEAKGSSQLKHPASGSERYLVLPQASFGREVFGAVLGADLPELDGGEYIQALHLSDDTTEKLSCLPLYGLSLYLSIQDLVITDFSQAKYVDITGPVKDEIALALRRRTRGVADKLRVEVEKQAEIVELRNNLMPEIELSHQQLKRLDKVPLTDLGLIKRWCNALKRKNGIITVGALLRMNRQGLRGIRDVGVKTEAAIIGKLAAFLEVQANLKSQ